MKPLQLNCRRTTCTKETAYLHQGNNMRSPPQRGRSHGGNGFSAPCRKISCAVQTIGVKQHPMKPYAPIRCSFSVVFM